MSFTTLIFQQDEVEASIVSRKSLYEDTGSFLAMCKESYPELLKGHSYGIRDVTEDHIRLCTRPASKLRHEFPNGYYMFAPFGGRGSIPVYVLMLKKIRSDGGKGMYNKKMIKPSELRKLNLINEHRYEDMKGTIETLDYMGEGPLAKATASQRGYIHGLCRVLNIDDSCDLPYHIKDVSDLTISEAAEVIEILIEIRDGISL